jgi:hypothetical protein
LPRTSSGSWQNTIYHGQKFRFLSGGPRDNARSPSGRNVSGRT